MRYTPDAWYIDPPSIRVDVEKEGEKIKRARTITVPKRGYDDELFNEDDDNIPNSD